MTIAASWVHGRVETLPGVGHIPDADLLLVFARAVETNGHQNCARWVEMESYHPCEAAAWREPRDGVFPVGDGFRPERMHLSAV